MRRPAAVLAVLLCAPSIVGTALLTWLAFAQRRPAPPPSPGWLDQAPGVLATVLTFGSLYGATYGPWLIPLAVLLLPRAREGGRAPRALWLVVALAIVATAVFYGWTMNALELP